MDALLVTASTSDLRSGEPIQMQDTSFMGHSVSTTVSLRLKIDSATPSITRATKQKQMKKKERKSKLEVGCWFFLFCLFVQNSKQVVISKSGAIQACGYIEDILITTFSLLPHILSILTKRIRKVGQRVLKNKALTHHEQYCSWAINNKRND